MDVPALVTALSRFALATEQGRAGARLPSLGTAVDWPAVLELATVHRVAPLIQQALAAAPKGAVPGPVMAQFDAALWHSQAATLLCEHELASLLTMLAAARVNVLVLKGATLAHTLYPRPELRPYHDLDIVCRHADYPRLASALTAAGYAAEATNEPWVRLSPLASFPVQTYRPPSGTLDIEVHTDVLQLGLVERNHEGLWSEAETLLLRSVAVRSLAPIHQVLLLAVHAHRHGYVRLLWLVDLDLFVRRWGMTLDWVSAMTLARDEGMGLVLRHALATTRAVLGTPLPPLPSPTREERLLAPLYRWLWPRAPVCRLERIERRRLLRFRPDSGDPRDFSYGLMLLGRRREKLKVLLEFRR